MSVLNFNLGVLGHVDSGKTTLVKALSSVASTACFDKNPQSKERGITLDLGFSSFTVDFPQHLTSSEQYSQLQFTLVDCPGHASLIKTIIGGQLVPFPRCFHRYSPFSDSFRHPGAQIIDMMLLVIDITKGMQTQTAECLVIGEITCDKMIVVLNKIDLVEPAKRNLTIEKVGTLSVPNITIKLHLIIHFIVFKNLFFFIQMKKKVSMTLKNTKFKDCSIVSVSAVSETDPGCSVKDLMDTLTRCAFIPKRDSKGSLLFAVDHCFPIKGQGTVLTGTILQGQISVNDVSLPFLAD